MYMKLMGKLGLVLVVWVALVFAQSNTVDQIVSSWPSTVVTGTHWTVYDHANPSARWTDEADPAALSMMFGTSMFWSSDPGLNFPPPIPAAGDTLGIIGSFDPQYAASPGTYGSNAAHKGYYWVYSEQLTSSTDNHWMTDTCRALPKPAAAQGSKGPQDSVEVSIQNPAETRYAGQTSYDVLGYDLWVDTTGTGTPDAYASGIHLGFYPVLGTAGQYTLIKWWPADYFAEETYTCYHAYYLVAAPGFTTDQEEGHSTAYLSENSEATAIVGIAELKDAIPMHMSLNAAPSITRDRAVLSYALTKTTPVTVTIYNASGQVVSTLIDGVQAAGEHSVMFDGTDAPSGVYFCQLKTPDAQLQTKLTVLR
jgi:hypothetical protein